jgi:arginase
LREAGLLRRLQALGYDLQDRGDLSGPFTPMQLPVDGCRHLREVLVWNSAVHDAVGAELAQGRLPLLLGGDHSLAIGSISAVARHCRARGKTLRVLWLDAHADCNTPRTSPSGNLHGMPVACLCGHGPAALTELSGQVPAIAPAAIRQVGIRSVDVGEWALVQTLDLVVFDMQAVAEQGMRRVMAQALDGVDENTHLHVSFDVDFLDPGIAPGVGTTVAGGPGWRDAQLCMTMIAQTRRLASLDVMEFNPTLAARRATAEVTVRLVETLLA